MEEWLRLPASFSLSRARWANSTSLTPHPRETVYLEVVAHGCRVRGVCFWLQVAVTAGVWQLLVCRCFVLRGRVVLAVCRGVRV